MIFQAYMSRKSQYKAIFLMHTKNSLVVRLYLCHVDVILYLKSNRLGMKIKVIHKD